MQEGKKKKKKKKTSFKVFKIILITILSLIILSGVALGGVVLAIINTAPPLDVNEILTLNEPSIIYDSSDKYMDNVITDEKRTVVSIKDVPDNLKHAFVSIEDERFYTHKGVDAKRLAGVVYIDVMNKIKHVNTLQGASTITQQLISNTLLSKEVTIKRKVQEMYLALQLEKRLSKDQILEAYINTIFLGGNAHGVEAAANQYFNKSVKDLSLIECAYIAGVPQSPSVYYPFSDAAKKNPSRYLNRTKMVLEKMYENGYIKKDQYDAALKDLNDKKLVFQQPSSTSNKMNYEWFSLPAIVQVKNDLKAQYHYNDTEINNLLMYGGLKIYTTMDRDLQDATKKVLDDNKNYGNVSVQPQASAVIIDYHTGEVKTIIGGRGEQPPRSFNRAAFNGSKEFLKPVGSSIKPLTVYSAAIDSKLATAATVVSDSPLPEEIGKKYGPPGQPYNPRNYETGYFSGDVTIREAIKKSINLVAIKLEDTISLKTGSAYGEKYGLPLVTQDKQSIAALSLGELTYGTNTLTMATAYGVFGNNGVYTQPRLYRKVVDKRGISILETKPNTRKVLSPQSAYIMYDLLKGPTSDGGTAPNARFSSMPVAGKTGTSGDMKNFWFCGLTPYYSAAVWIGDDIPKSRRDISSSTSAGIWQKIMAEAHKNLPVKDIEKPSGIVTATVCADSGKIPTDLCAKDPRGNRAVTDIFAEGTVPVSLCDAHVEAQINKLNGKIATANTPADLIETRVFIKKEYANDEKDKPYILPTELDDTKPQTTVPSTTTTLPNGTNTTNNNNTNNNNGNTNTNTNTNTNNGTTTGTTTGNNNAGGVNQENTGTTPNNTSH
jgi:penicillin-binding protein 1A